MSGHSVRNKASTRSAAIQVALFAFVGAALWTVLLFLSAFFALQKDWNGIALTAAAYVCCALSAFLCSFLCAKTVSNRKALYGMLSAMPTLLLLAVLCFALYGKIGTGFGVACLIVLLCAALGSVLAVWRKTKKRYKKIGAVR